MTQAERPERKYLVATFMTQGEIEQRQATYGDTDLRGSVHLKTYSRWGGWELTDHDIGRMIRDAGEALEMDGAEDWDSDSFAPLSLPFAMRVAILDFAELGWYPGDDNVMSEWHGSDGLFDTFPELREFLTLTAHEIGKAWDRRVNIIVYCALDGKRMEIRRDELERYRRLLPKPCLCPAPELPDWADMGVCRKCWCWHEPGRVVEEVA